MRGKMIFIFSICLVLVGLRAKTSFLFSETQSSESPMSVETNVELPLQTQRRIPNHAESQPESVRYRNPDPSVLRADKSALQDALNGSYPRIKSLEKIPSGRHSNDEFDHGSTFLSAFLLNLEHPLHCRSCVEGACTHHKGSIDGVAWGRDW